MHITFVHVKVKPEYRQQFIEASLENGGIRSRSRGPSDSICYSRRTIRTALCCWRSIGTRPPQLPTSRRAHYVTLAGHGGPVDGTAAARGAVSGYLSWPSRISGLPQMIGPGIRPDDCLVLLNVPERWRGIWLQVWWVLPLVPRPA